MPFAHCFGSERPEKKTSGKTFISESKHSLFILPEELNPGQIGLGDMWVCSQSAHVGGGQNTLGPTK